MNTTRKILIITGVIILAMMIFGFQEEERYDYSRDRGGGFGQPEYGPAYEFTVTNFEMPSYSSWEGKKGPHSMEDHLNAMGSQGWALVSVERGTFSDEFIFIFTRPVARWH